MRCTYVSSRGLCIACLSSLGSHGASSLLLAASLFCFVTSRRALQFVADRLVSSFPQNASSQSLVLCTPTLTVDCLRTCAASHSRKTRLAAPGHSRSGPASLTLTDSEWTLASRWRHSHMAQSTPTHTHSALPPAHRAACSRHRSERKDSACRRETRSRRAAAMQQRLDCFARGSAQRGKERPRRAVLPA